MEEVAGIEDRSTPGGGATTVQRAPRSRELLDSLYGEVRVASWAAALLATPPFQRLAGVSLSDVPGELLFCRPFPSRLDHALGVYHLARLARPHDRALQAAALAHDLGHGPFSHLTEPLMRERLGMDHEVRSAALLAAVRAAPPASSAQQLAWLDWDAVARLIVGHEDGRGALLNGQLDYDNADNVARFLKAAGLGRPSYDPAALARGLRPLPPAAATPGERVYLQAAVEPDAMGWLADRSIVYRFLHEGHHNLAAHAMLRKAVDLGAATGILPDNFFDLTDVQALRLLGHALHRGLVALVQRVRAGEHQHHGCVWEAEAPGPTIPALLRGWRERLALEQQLAQEAALAPHEVIVEAVVSRAGRALPPLAKAGTFGTFVGMAAPPPAPRMLHVFAARDAAPDYIRRLRLAAERHFALLGARPRAVGQDE
jgi:HD superfamily phosphohydrolase